MTACEGCLLMLLPARTPGVSPSPSEPDATSDDAPVVVDLPWLSTLCPCERDELATEGSFKAIMERMWEGMAGFHATMATRLLGRGSPFDRGGKKRDTSYGVICTLTTTFIWQVAECAPAAPGPSSDTVRTCLSTSSSTPFSASVQNCETIRRAMESGTLGSTLSTTNVPRKPMLALLAVARRSDRATPALGCPRSAEAAALPSRLSSSLAKAGSTFISATCSPMAMRRPSRLSAARVSLSAPVISRGPRATMKAFSKQSMASNRLPKPPCMDRTCWTSGMMCPWRCTPKTVRCVEITRSMPVSRYLRMNLSWMLARGWGMSSETFNVSSSR